MRSPKEDEAIIKAKAIAWLARRDAGLTEAEEAAFQKWRGEKPDHASAIAELEAAWAALDTPGSIGAVEIVRGEINRRSRRRTWRRCIISAASLCVFLAAGLWLQVSRVSPSPIVTARVVTATQERLSDGSVAELLLGARIENDFDEHSRRVTLLSGEGFFSVMKDPVRPFIVQVGPFSVRAVGTQFAVRLGGGEIEVVVTEGRVQVTRNSEPEHAMVSHGHKLTLSHDAATPLPPPVALSPAQLNQHTTWRVPRFEFTDTSIAEAVGLFNQFNAVRLKVADRAVAELLVTGVFRSDNVQGFVNVLEKSFGIRVERSNPDEIVLQNVR